MSSNGSPTRIDAISTLVYVFIRRNSVTTTSFCIVIFFVIFFFSCTEDWHGQFYNGYPNEPYHIGGPNWPAFNCLVHVA
jgi:hypothetical protein